MPLATWPKTLSPPDWPDVCEVQIAYAIGVARPVSIFVESFGTGKLTNAELAEVVAAHFDLRPAAIIEQLDLRRPIYRQTAAYGHFGRTDLDLPWERTNGQSATAGCRLKMSSGKRDFQRNSACVPEVGTVGEQPCPWKPITQ